MGITISVGIQKGGAGKTTTTAMLASLMSQRGFRVLAVDFDGQGNLTQMLSQLDPYTFSEKTSLEACKNFDPTPYIVEVAPNLHLLPATDILSRFASWIYIDYLKILKSRGSKDPFAGSKVLNDTLEVVKNDYDYILVDLPPNLGEQTINGISASDYCIVATQAEPFSKSAIDNYLEIIKSSKEKVNPNVKLLGIVATMVDDRNLLPTYMLEQIKEGYGNLLFNTRVKRRARILEYSIEGIKDKATTKIDKVAQENYNDLLDEIIIRIGVGGKNKP